MLQNHSNNWMVWCVHMQTLQGTQEMTLLRLLLNEHKSSIYGIDFSCINSDLTIKAVTVDLIFIDKCTTSQTSRKQPFSKIHTYTAMYSGEMEMSSAKYQRCQY